jgi:NhaP-type Na+/H+ or K+/H+ antiporter
VRAHHLRSSIPSSLVSLFDVVVVVVVVVVVSTLAHRGSFTLGVSKKRVVREQQNSIQQTTTQNNNKQTKIEKKN